MGIRLVALTLVAALVAPAPATAHDDGPPEAVVVTSLGSRAAALHATEWASGDARRCAVISTDDYYEWRNPPVPWVPGTEIVVRFDTPHKPVRVRAIAFLSGDPTTGTPVYGKTEVPHELREAEVDGKKTWEAVLSPLPSPDLYVDVFARWKGVPGCGVREGAWSFRAGLLPL
jgi:hypothetical protein